MAEGFEVRSGDLIKALLPFNESTSSNDQSNVNISTTNNASVFSSEVINKYQPYAIALRSLIRFKMSDTNDVKLVSLTLHLLTIFDFFCVL